MMTLSLFLSFFILTSTQVVDEPYLMQYLSRSNFTPAFTFNDPTWTFSPISQFDDAPYQVINLNFPFPYFNETYSTIYLDPNGGIQFESSLPCCSNIFGCSFSIGGCTIDTSYFNRIFYFVTDFWPAAHYPQRSRISYRNQATSFSIKFENISLYFDPSIQPTPIEDETMQYNFIGTIYNWGKIETHYYNIWDPVIVSNWITPGAYERRLLVGLRQARGRDVPTDRRFEWGTFGNGVYPPRSPLFNSPLPVTLFHWPFFSKFCYYPRTIIFDTNNTQLDPAMIDNNNNLSTPIQFLFQSRQPINRLFNLVNISCVFKFNNNNTILAETLLSAIWMNVSEGNGNGTWFVRCMAPSATYVLENHPNGTSTNLTSIAVRVEITEVITRQPIPFSTIVLLFAVRNSSIANVSNVKVFCDECSTYFPTYCWKDCNSDWRGTASLDNCSVCSEGNTNRPRNLDIDCEGICFGPFNITNENQCACFNITRCNTLIQQRNLLFPSLPTSNQYIYLLNDSLVNEMINNEWNQSLVINSCSIEWINLPFVFPFYDQNYTTVGVNINGVLVFGNTSTNCPCLQSGLQALFYQSIANTITPRCNYTLIASYLTELFLNDTNGTNGSISYIISSQSFCVNYNIFFVTNITNNTSSLVSFRICIYSNGDIISSYDNILDPNSFLAINGLPKQWLVGLRAGNSTILRPFGGTSVRNDWLPYFPTTRDRYLLAPRSQITSNNSITFCRISEDFCITPSRVGLDGGIIHVSARNFDCRSKFTFFCQFGRITVPAIYNDSLNAFDCLAPPASSNQTILVRLFINQTELPTRRTLSLSYFSNITISETVDIICNECSNFSVNYCWRDCARAWRGSSYIDECGVCTLQSTLDCEGFCGGPFRLDTNGQCSCLGIACVNFTYSYDSIPDPSAAQYIPVFNSSISHVDDIFIPTSLTTNLEQVSLAFNFPFFNQSFQSIFIDSGVIHFKNLSFLCRDQGYSSLFFQEQAQNSCSYTMIAGFLTNFDPSLVSISYLSNQTLFCVRYTNLSTNFDICILPSGDIFIDYKEIYLGDLNQSTWLVGLTQNIPIISPYTGNLSRQDWLSGNPSARLNWILPFQSWIQPATSLSFCRISYDYCITPRSVDMTGGPVRVLASKFDCNAPLNYTCMFGSIEAQGTYNTSTFTIDCQAPPGINYSTVVFRLKVNGYELPSKRKILFSYLPSAPTSQDPITSLCQDCGFFLPQFCWRDCANIWRGNNIIDECGVCTLSSTLDCEGICSGPFSLINTTTQNQCVCQSNCSFNNPLPNPNAISYLVGYNQPSSPSFETSLNFTNLSFSTVNLQRISLPWNFSFYSGSYSSIFISPDGAVHLVNTSSICLQNGYFPLFFERNASVNCTYVLIGGFLTDFSLVNLAINYFLDNTQVCITYRNLTLTGNSTINYNFDLCLYRNGNIIINYLNVDNPKFYNGWIQNQTRQWIIGLRDGNSSIPASEERYRSQWLENYVSSRSNWQVVDQNMVKSNNSVQFCRLSGDFCVFPLVGPPEGNLIQIVGLDLTCLNNTNLQCRFGLLTTPAILDLTRKVISCSSPPGVVGTSVVFGLNYGNQTIGMRRKFIYTYVSQNDSRLNISSTLDSLCDQCSTFNPTICWKDCAGVWQGTSFIDTCGTCTKTSTLDCEGFCSGPFRITNNQCLCSNTSLCNNFTSQFSQIPNYQLRQYIYLQGIEENNFIGNFSMVNTSSEILQRVILPFTFPFFSNNYTEVWISNDGMIQLRNDALACYTQGYSNLLYSSAQTQTNCNYTLIALFTTDFQLNSQVTYTMDLGNFCIFYSNLSLITLDNTTTNSTSFKACLYRNGNITVWYDDITDPELYSSWYRTPRQWITGLRDGNRVLNRLNGSNEVVSVNGSAFGSYLTTSSWLRNFTSSRQFWLNPDKNKIQSKTSVDYCQISQDFCVTPMILPPTGGVVHLSFTSQCQFSRLNLTCRFGLIDSFAIFNATTQSFTCQVPSGTNSTLVRFHLYQNGIEIPRYRETFITYNDQVILSDPTTTLCNTCGSLLPIYCWKDCAGQWRGMSYIDECGICTINSTLDCERTCNNYFSLSNLKQCRCINQSYCQPYINQFLTPPQPNATQYIAIIGPYRHIETLNMYTTVFPRNSPSQINYSSVLPSLTLPFNLSFFNRRTNRIFISPDGAIHYQDTTLPCITQGYRALFISNFSLGCSYNLAAGFLTDFSTSGDVSVMVSTSILGPELNGTLNNQNFTCVRYRNMTLEAGNTTIGPLFTFEVCLYQQGDIVVSYETITDPSLYGEYNQSYPRQWVIGLTNNQTIGSYLDQNSSLSWFPYNPTNRNNWQFTYPSISSLSTLYWCNFPRDYCLYPSSGSILYIMMRNITAECLNSVQLYCSFGNITTPLTIDPVLQRFRCDIPVGTLDTVVVFRIMVMTNQNLQELPTVRKQFYYYRSNISSFDMQNFCGQCGIFDLSYCWLSCDGRYRGSAIRDDCGRCVLGVTNATFNQDKDCTGQCGGNFRINPTTQQCELQEVNCCAQLNSQPCLSINTSPYYFPFMSKIKPPVGNYSMSLSITSGVTLAELPFTFEYFDQPYRRIYILRSGIIAFEPITEDCANQVFSLLSSPSPTCNFLFIIGSTANFTSLPTFVTIRQSSSYFCIEYRNLFSQLQSHSFDICLYSTQTISIHYYTIYTELTLPNEWYASSLIQPLSSNFIYSRDLINYTDIDPNIRFQWTTLRNNQLRGLFIPKNYVQPNTTVLLCWISMDLCIYPRVVDPNIPTVINIFLKTQSCVYEQEYMCKFGNKLTSAMYNNNTQTYECLSPSGTTSTTVIFSFVEKVSGRQVHRNTLYFSFLTGSSSSSSSSSSSLSSSLSEICPDIYKVATALCPVDCAGRPGGNFTLNSCQRCTQPNSVNNDLDCEGICYGPFRSLVGYPVETSCGCQPTTSGNVPLKCSLYMRSEGKPITDIYYEFVPYRTSLVVFLGILFGYTLLVFGQKVSAIRRLFKKIRTYRFSEDRTS